MSHDHTLAWVYVIVSTRFLHHALFHVRGPVTLCFGHENTTPEYLAQM